MAREIEQREIALGEEDSPSEVVLERLGKAVSTDGARLPARSLLPNRFHPPLRSGEVGLSTPMRRGS